MGRKYAKNAITKGNVLKLVAALLKLADDELTLPPEKLKTTFKVDWVTEDQLQVSGTVQQKGKKRPKTVEKGVTKEDLWTLVESTGEALKLPQPKDRQKVDYEQQKKNAVQDVFDCLQDLGLFIDQRSATNTPYWKFRLKLKHQTAESENLQLIEEQWEQTIGVVSDSDSPTPPNNPFNWPEICKRTLSEQTQRHQATGYGIGHEVNIYVPLGLVKPKQQSRRDAKQQPDAAAGMKQYQLREETEIERRYEYQEFLEQIIGQTGKNLAIIGEPGAGKTTWLEQIAQDLTGDCCPIWIPLARLQGLTLEDYLLQQWLKDAFPDQLDPTPQQKQALVELFNSGKVWLLLDGVDEMKTDNSPLRHIDESLTGWVKKARVVLTCRLNVWEVNPNALPEFDPYRTLCFEEGQIEDFITQWFSRTEKPELGGQLWVKLQQEDNARLLDLVKNPLRLSLLCRTWWFNPDELPTTQASLYQQFRDDFYRWKQDEFPTSWNEQQTLNERLSKLAWRAIDESSPLRESLVYEVLGEWVELAQQLGWLNFVYREVQTDEAIYAFFHLTFQEYFAACAVEDWGYFLPREHNPSHPPLSQPYRIFEERWREVILLWLGREDIADEEKEEFIEELVSFEDGCGGYYKYTAYFLAAAGINEFKTCFRADTIVQKVVKWGFGYFDEEEQQWLTFPYPIERGARETIPHTDRKRAIRPLVNLLQSVHCLESTRGEVASMLSNIGKSNYQLITELFRIFETTANILIREQAIYILGEIAKGNDKAICTLINILATTYDEDIREQLVSILNDIGTGNNKAIGELIRILETTHDEELREIVSSILNDIGTGNDKAISELIRILETTHDEELRQESAFILGSFGKENIKVYQKLGQMIDHSNNKEIRYNAASALAKSDPHNHKAITTLINFFETTENKLKRNRATWCLEQIVLKNTKIIPRLIEIIKTNKNEEICCNAASIIVKSNNNHNLAIPALIKLLETSKNESVCYKAAYSLGKVDPRHPQVIAALVRIIETTKNEEVCCQAASTLVEINSNHNLAIPALIKLLETSKNESVCYKAAYSLGKIDPRHPQVIAALVRIIETTKNEEVCCQAAYSLGKIDPHHPQAIAALVRIIETTGDKELREQTGIKLSEIGLYSRQAIAELIDVLETTKNKEVCLQVIYILVGIGKGNTQVMAVLVKILETTDDQKICLQAACSLRLIVQGNSNTLDEVIENRPKAAAKLIQFFKKITHFDFSFLDSTEQKLYETVSSLKTNDTNWERLWNIAQDLPYPDFYHAWHFGNQDPQTLATQLTLENQLLDLPNQLHPTPNTIPLCLDIHTLLTETDPSEIIDLLWQKIYETAYPNASELPPEVTKNSQLIRHLKQLKKDLKTPNLALILYDKTPDSTQGASIAPLRELVEKLTDIVQVAWLTETPLAPPLTSFPPQQPHLISALETWLDEMG